MSFLIIPCTLENYRSLKDKSMKVTFETGELNPQDLLGIAENLGAYGYLAFKQEPFKADEKEMMQDLKSDFEFKGKSNSQRLKAVLFLMWQKDNEGFDTSVRHYDHHMEKIINHFKSKLD